MKSRKSPRRSDYDYASGGGYFVTICTAGRQHYFGEICRRDDTSGRPPCMQLNNLGNIIDQQIKSLPNKRSTIDVHEYIIMPNHIHLLIIMDEWRRDDSSGRPLDSDHNIQGHAEIVSLRRQPPRPQYGSLGYIINQFKGGCTREINKQSTEGKLQIPYGDTFARQPRYHDHIIRNQQSYDQIKYYIQTNPQNRESDTFNQ